MIKYSLFIFTFFVTIHLISCHYKKENKPYSNNSESIFSAFNNDTLLFASHKSNLPQILSNDSAFRISDLVTVCTVMSIDNTVHETEKAPFYLVGVKIDTVLKGNARIGGLLYFISKQRPSFMHGTNGWILYLCKRKTARLLMYNNILWQWVNNAPFVRNDWREMVEKIAPKKVKKIKRRWWSRSHP